MESPLKKKKLHHHYDHNSYNNQAMSMDVDNSENVQVILSDEVDPNDLLFGGLKKQLGGSKIRVIKPTITHYMKSPVEKFEYSQILSDNLLQIDQSLYNASGNLKRRIPRLTVNTFRKSVRVYDSKAEFVYTLDCNLRKIRVANNELMWVSSISDNFSGFQFCESRNEIYGLVNSKKFEVKVLNASNRHPIRNIEIEVMTLDNDFVPIDFKYDPQEPILYILYYGFLLVYEEKTKKATYIRKRFRKVFIYANKYYVLLDDNYTFHVYEKATNELFSSYSKEFLKIIHFDEVSGAFYILSQEGSIDKLDLTHSILIEKPLKKEIWKQIERLGGVLPRHILRNDAIPDSVQTLLSINFNNKIFHYNYDTVIGMFRFTKDISTRWKVEEWIGDGLHIGGCLHSRLEQPQYDLAMGIFMEKPDLNLSNINEDFPICMAFVYADEKVEDIDCDVHIISYYLSDFIQKLSLVECIDLAPNEKYLINFEKIYEHLLYLGSINSESKLIDPNILSRKFLEQESKIFSNLKEYFQNSVIRINDVVYRKIDLIALAGECNSSYHFVSLEYFKDIV